MNDASALPQTSLSPMEMEFFLTAIETSARIRNRSQFYLWSQGGLQNFIPHQTLIACLGTPGSKLAHTEISTCCVFDPQQEHKLCCGEDSLIAVLTQEWEETGRHPLVVLAANGPAGEALAAHGFSSALCHGSQSLNQQGASFFVFLEIANRPVKRLGYMLELFMPHLHMALMNLSHAENPGAAGEKFIPVQASLSNREDDVLQWIRAGKTNYEIGIILDISPLTVKNHVQKILRKLNVSNRAQAAAWASKNKENQAPSQ